MSEKATLEDIAKVLGVSTVTVSNALAGRSGVSEKVRREVMEKAREMGYQKNRRREKTAAASGRRIGVIVAEWYLKKYVTYYWEVYQNVVMEASREGCVVLLEVLLEEKTLKRELPVLIQKRETDALIVLGKLEHDYFRKIFDHAECPVLTLDFRDERIPCDSVISNGFVGMYQMTNYLISQGHREIGFVGEIRATESIMDRYQGYCKSLMEHGISENPDWILPDRNVENKVERIRLPQRLPTAFVCNCDGTAEKLAVELGEIGLRIPEDISVVGYDDFLAEGMMQNHLTTYAVDVDTMAYLSLKQLLGRLDGDQGPGKMQVVDGRVVIRDSVLPCVKNDIEEI